MSHGRKAARRSADVELNLAAMLDMAFQLLTFFILTFRPAPIEGQLLLNLPPAQAISSARSVALEGVDFTREPPRLDALVVGLSGGQSGRIESIALNGQNVANVSQLESRLQRIVGDKYSTFQQVVVQIGSEIQYGEMLRVMDVCARLKQHDGKPLAGLSLMELPKAG